MRIATKTIGLAGALLLACMSGNCRADFVCPKFMWMNWGSYQSYYAIYIQGSVCNDVGSAANYDARSTITPLPMNCPCTQLLLEDRKDGDAPKKGEIPRRRSGTDRRNSHHQVEAGLRLPAKVGRVVKDKQVENPNWLKRSVPDTYRWVEFCVVDEESGDSVTTNAVLQLTQLEKQPGMNVPAYIPQYASFATGQEVTPDVEFNGPPVTFIRLPQGNVNRVNENVVELTLGSVTYVVLMHTLVDSIPETCQ